MGTLKLSNSSGNFIALDAPSSIASDKTFTLPNADGSSGQVIQTNGSGALSFVDQTTDTNTQINESAVSATTSGTEVAIDSIPSDAKRIMITWQNIDSNSSTDVIIRIGDSGGIESTGYEQTVRTGSLLDTFTDGWHVGEFGNSTAVRYGHAFLTTTGSNLWICTGISFLRYSGGSNTTYFAGYKTLSGTLDRVSLGVDSGAFDGGSFRIAWET